MLAGDNAAQGSRQSHNTRYRLVSFLQHLVVIGIDRQIGMDITVAGMHVQCHEHAAAQNLFMHCLDPLNHRPEIVAFENLH